MDKDPVPAFVCPIACFTPSPATAPPASPWCFQEGLTALAHLLPLHEQAWLSEPYKPQGPQAQGEVKEEGGRVEGTDFSLAQEKFGCHSYAKKACSADSCQMEHC